MVGDQRKFNRQRKRGPLGCLLSPLLYPIRVIGRQFSFTVLAFAVAFGACGACALFAPVAFRQIIDTVRSAGLRAYTLILGISGQPAFRIVTYDVMVTAYARVDRDMGLLSLAFGQGAEVMGSARVSFGADIERQQFGIMGCDIDTNSLRTRTGSAPLAGFAFDLEQIEQEAFRFFKEQIAREAIKQYWPVARQELQRRMQELPGSWLASVEAPEQPNLAQCPENLAPDPANPTNTAPKIN